MKKSLQIPNEINDVITAMVAPFSITSISENSGVSTIITTTVTIFDNLSTTMLLQDGMIVTLDSINYVVSNVINSLVQSFDITATGLTATEWSIAANFKPGTRKEINQILDQESGSLDRFPLIWLILPNSKDYDNEVIDFTTDLVLVFAHKSNDTDRSQKRYDENISPVIQPLLDLFLLWVASSDFNYMFEFEGYGKPIDYNDSPFAFYGNDDKTKSVLEVNTDAIEVSMELNFKKQFEYPTVVSYKNGVVTNAYFEETAVFDFEVKINLFTPITFTIDWGTEVGETTIETTLDNGVYKALQTSILIPEGVTANQTINVSDNFGGLYSVDYLIEPLYVSEYQAVYDSFTIKPNDTIALEQNAMVEGWVDSGVWAKEDIIYVFAAHTNDNSEALVNWKNPGTNDATLVNDPPFVAFEGFTGNGTTQHISSNYNAFTQGVNYQLNSASGGFYSRTNSTSVVADFGALSGSNRTYIKSFNGVNCFHNINDNSQTGGAVSDSLGMFVTSRINDDKFLYKNKSLIQTTDSPPIGVPNHIFQFLALTPLGSYSVRQLSLGFAGGSLIQQNVDDLTDYFETYMDSNGKGVIT